MKSDLHVHTYFSYDGLSSPESIVNAALQKNLGCIAITDHHKTQGAKEAFIKAFDKPLLVIPGIEVNSKSGDILGLNVEKEIPRGLSAEETIERIKKQNGTVVIPHPFHFLRNFKGLKETVKLVDAIEVFNGAAFGKANQKALEFVSDNKLPFTAGSDSHSKTFVGKGFIETPEVRNAQQLIEKIINKEAEVGSEYPTTLEKLMAQSRIVIGIIRNLFPRKTKHFTKEEEEKYYSLRAKG